MPWGVAASVAGAVVSSAMAPSPSGGGSSGSGPYIGAYQPQMDTNFNNAYNTYGNINQAYYGNTFPIAQTAYSNVAANPYQGQYLAGNQQAQGAYYGAAGQNIGQGQNLYNAGNSLINAGQNWDPNGSMRNYLLQQAGDTANAQSYLRGIQGSPYGATVATNAIDQAALGYQTQALNNQIAGTQAGGQAIGQGSTLQNLGAGQYATGAALPYNAQNTIGNNQFGAIGNYYGTLSPYLQNLSNQQGSALQYLGYGVNSQQTGAAQQAGAASNISQALTPAFQQAGQGLAGAFGGSTSYGNPFSTGTSMYSTPSTYDYYGANSLGSSFGGLGY